MMINTGTIASQNSSSSNIMSQGQSFQEPKEYLIFTKSNPKSTKISSRCLDITHGFLNALLMISLQFSGQFTPNQQIPLPGVFERSTFQSNGILVDYFEPLYMFWLGMTISTQVKKEFRSTLTLQAGAGIRLLGMLLTGLLVNAILSGFDFSQLRLMGFLQKVFLVNSILLCLHLYASIRVQYFVVLLMFMSYIGIITTVVGTNCTLGSIALSYPDCNGICFLDTKILTPSHMDYSNYDSEGVFCILNVLFVAYTGYSFGRSVQNSKPRRGKRTLLYWMMGGCLLFLVGILLTLNWQFIPVIYTTNFTLFSTGIAIEIFLFIHIMLDIWEISNQVIIKLLLPLEWMGKNGLVLLGLRILLQAILVQTESAGSIRSALGFTGSSSADGLLFNFYFLILFFFLAFLVRRIHISIKF